MLDLVEKEVTVAADRLPVILVHLDPNLVEAYGFYIDLNGRRAVFIDADVKDPDAITLLHEIGHAAGLPHSGQNGPGGIPIDVGDPWNFMREGAKGPTRFSITVTQGDFLAKAFFAK